MCAIVRRSTHKEANMQLELIMYLKKNGLKQNDLADLLGVHHSRITRMLQGKRRITAMEAEKICRWTKGEVSAREMLLACRHIRLVRSSRK